MFLFYAIISLLLRTAQGYTVGFSYSVAGLLFPYHAGVTHRLKEAGILLPTTPLNGASGGALAAACASSHLTTDEAMSASLRIASRCTAEGSFLNLGRILRDELTEVCTEGMVESINARPAPAEFLYTTAPCLTPRRGGAPFASPADLVDVLAASCYIPLYSGIVPVTSVRGEWGLDGFLSTPSTFGCQIATGADETVFCTPFSRLGEGGVSLIAPRAEEIPFPPDEYIALALGRPGPDEEQHRVLFELGMKCAARWIDDKVTA